MIILENLLVNLILTFAIMNIKIRLIFLKRAKLYLQMKNFVKFLMILFANIVSNIRLRIDEKYLTDCSDKTDPVKACINKFEKHPSIAFIKKWIYKKPLSSGKSRKVKS